MSTRSVTLVWSATVALAASGPARADWNHLGPVTVVERDDSTVTVRCGVAAVRIEATADHVVRVRLAPAGEFGRDFSWAVTDLRPRAKVGDFVDGPDALRFSCGALSVTVRRRPCRLQIADSEGETLVADDPRHGMAWQARNDVPPAVPLATQPARLPAPQAVCAWHLLLRDAAIYGLGEKTGYLEKGGAVWTMWNTDTAYGTATDPIYMSIPFFVVGRHGRFHGVFFDNPWRSFFDFGKEDRTAMRFGAEGGELNYYVIAGPHPRQVLERYTALTGRMELPPKWALGYQQSRYSYYPASRVREIARTFREKRIPCDVLYFDIDYMDGFRCFTWDPRTFPDPGRLIAELHEAGFHAVAIVDPGIKREPGYAVYDEGTREGAWVSWPNGKEYIGRVWPGECVFPDFTGAKVRDWWARLIPPFVGASGIDGLWCDMNEPADFARPENTLALDALHDNEGAPATHRACHNIYGMQMLRATREGLRRARPDRRVFTMTRAAYAGAQRYGAAWTGDNASTWEHLRLSLTMVLNLGASGMPFVGCDIGGFHGGPTPELFARWIQVGSLFPYCRTHCSWTSPDQEPWAFGPEVERVARRAIGRRYELLPYLYTLFEEASRTGVPVVRPLWMEFPDERGPHLDTMFMLGRDILVMPILDPLTPRPPAPSAPAAPPLWRTLPPGVWYDASTGLIHGGGQPVRLDASLDSLPMFIRAGAIIPMQSAVQHTGEKPAEPLILDVWPFGSSSAALYEDDGETLAYRRGDFRRTSFTLEKTDGGFALTMSPVEGNYTPPARRPLVRLHGLASSIVEVERLAEAASGADPQQARFDAREGTWTIRMASDAGTPQSVRLNVNERPQQHAGPQRSAGQGPGGQPVVFEFDDESGASLFTSDLLPPRYADGRASLIVKNTWRPFVILPRFRSALPRLRLRLSTQSTRRLILRFATEEEPTLSDRTQVGLEVVPDGQLRDYELDMPRASAGAWKGTVYWLRIDFADGSRSGETICLDRVSIEPAAPGP